jgi:hypothetical protein
MTKRLIRIGTLRFFEAPIVAGVLGPFDHDSPREHDPALVVILPRHVQIPHPFVFPHSDGRSLAGHELAENQRDLCPCGWAVLVSNELAYGMARIRGLMVGDSGIDNMPFYEVAQAAEWLDLSEDCFTGVGIWPAVVAQDWT